MQRVVDGVIIDHVFQPIVDSLAVSCFTIAKFLCYGVPTTIGITSYSRYVAGSFGLDAVAFEILIGAIFSCVLHLIIGWIESQQRANTVNPARIRLMTYRCVSVMLLIFMGANLLSGDVVVQTFIALVGYFASCTNNPTPIRSKLSESLS